MLRRVRVQLFFCYRESFPAPGFRGLPPPYPRFLWDPGTLSNPLVSAKAACCKSPFRIPGPMLRRVREQLFLCYRESFPAPGFRGLPPPAPASCETRAPAMRPPFQRRPPAVRARFAFRSLCFAGCGNSCSSVIGRAFPHPDPGGGSPHAPASYEKRVSPDLTYPFHRRPSFAPIIRGARAPVNVLRSAFGRGSRIPRAGRRSFSCCRGR